VRKLQAAVERKDLEVAAAMAAEQVERIHARLTADAAFREEYLRLMRKQNPRRYAETEAADDQGGAEEGTAAEAAKPDKAAMEAAKAKAKALIDSIMAAPKATTTEKKTDTVAEEAPKEAPQAAAAAAAPAVKEVKAVKAAVKAAPKPKVAKPEVRVEVACRGCVSRLRRGCREGGLGTRGTSGESVVWSCCANRLTDGRGERRAQQELNRGRKAADLPKEVLRLLETEKGASGDEEDVSSLSRAKAEEAEERKRRLAAKAAKAKAAAEEKVVEGMRKKAERKSRAKGGGGAEAAAAAAAATAAVERTEAEAAAAAGPSNAAVERTEAAKPALRRKRGKGGKVMVETPWAAQRKQMERYGLVGMAVLLVLLMLWAMFF